MAKSDKREDITSGMWKFNENISLEALIQLAKEWKHKADGDKYLDLHVRQCSKDQYGIGFMYLAGENGHKEFFYRMTDQLKRHFGNDFVGWDVADTTWLINEESQVDTKKYPPISPETSVRTTQANPEIDDWDAGALLKRQWGVEGIVIDHHDSHGLCYEVKHPDGTVGCYDPSELEVITD